MGGGGPGASTCSGAPAEGRTPALCSQPKAQTKAIIPNTATTTIIDLIGVRLLNNAIPLFVLCMAISSLLKILISGKAR